MKEFKIFVIAVFVFFITWIVSAYLFAGTIVLISGFSEHLYITVNQPVVIVISFFISVISVVVLVNSLNAEN